jgi:ABC-2 type transport system ATP-binding protein
MGDAMILTEELKKNFGSTEALRGVSLHVPPGELFAFLGPNGAGKTTTIRILTGLTRVGVGRAWLDGHDIETQALAAKRTCGVVHQQLNLDGDLTVEENLDLHGRLFDLSSARRRGRIAELLDYVGMLERRKSLVRELSGGMKRRVMIARALVHEPRILFLDEPTVGLDPGIRRRIWALIRRIHSDGATVFLTTHYIEEAEFLAQRVAFIDQGRIVALDSPGNLMARQGAWALDVLRGDQLQTSYFATQEEAKRHSAAHEGAFTLRRVNLEDSFLALTGRKVA